MSQFLLALGAGLAILLIGTVAKSFALPTAGWIVRTWVWFLTLGLTVEIKNARRMEIASDLWENGQEGIAVGYAPHQIALHILLRLLIGMPSDTLWRLRQVRLDYVLLAGGTVLMLGGLAVGWEGSLQVWVVRVIVAAATLMLIVSVSMMREVVTPRFGFGLHRRASRRKQPRSLDYTLIVVTAMLLVAGLLAVYTASQPVGYLRFGGNNYDAVRQALYAIVGVAALLCFMRLNYRQLPYLAVPMMAVALVGLLVVLVPGLGADRNGARRLLEIGPILFQPGEFAKLAMIVYVSAWLAARRDNINKFTLGFAPFVLMVSVVGGLIIVEPDMGTAVVIVLTMSTLFFVAGAPVSHLVLLMVSGGLVSYAMILVQGASQHQPLVPDAQTDGIFAIIEHEVGFVGIALVMALLFFLAYRGLRVAVASTDRLGSLLALGVTCWIGYQAIMNIGGVVGAMPVIGVPMPFISYGGSSLIALLAAVGVLLSISRYKSLALGNGPTNRLIL